MYSNNDEQISGGTNMARAPSPYLMVLKTSKDGSTYQHYMKDKNGQRILRENATPEQLAMAKNADAPAVAAIPQVSDESIPVGGVVNTSSKWLMIKKVSKSGKTYTHYAKDAKGNRIPKDGVTPEQLAALQGPTPEHKAKAERRQKRAIAKINKMQKEKRTKQKIVGTTAIEMARIWDLQKHNKASIRGGDFGEKGTDYRVVEFNIEKDWLLIHAQVKKGPAKIDDEWYFYSPVAEVWQPFDINAYLALPKPRTINWPEKAIKVIAPQEEVPTPKKKRKEA